MNSRRAPALWPISPRKLAGALALVALFATPERGSACTLTTTGAGTIVNGTLYTLSLGAADTGDGLPTSWTIVWGDGAIQTLVGNPASVTHTYNRVGPYKILASATCGGRTYFQNDVVVGNTANDRVHWYSHDAATSLAVVRAPGTSGPDAGLDYADQPIVGLDGNVYVSASNSGNVVRYNETTGAFIDEFVTAGSGGLADAGGIKFGPDGNLYVAEFTASRVLRYNGSTGAFIDVFVTAGLGGLNGAQSLSFEPDGYLYVGSFNNNAVYRYDAYTGALVGTFVAPGSGGLNGPNDHTFGPDGRLYVSSDGSHEVLRYNGTTGAFIDAFFPAGSGGLLYPYGVTFGPDGHLYVGSWGTDEVLRYHGTGGAFMGAYVSAGLGGLNTTSKLDFIPEHQVRVVAVYDYRKRITIDRGQISDASCGPTLANFPMLFSSTDPDLRHTSFGGDVTELEGDDIIFRAFDTATCGGPTACTLDHEVERYDNTTGELVAWVRLPSVNTAAAGSDTVIYLTYGNATVTAPTENPAGVWDANYQGVWHLEEQVTDETVGGTHDDSTSLANNGSQTNNGPFAGEIADAQDFDGAGDFITVADDDSLSFGDSTTDSPFSVSAWVFVDTATSNVFVSKDSSASGEWELYMRSGGGGLALILNDGTLSNKLGRQTDAAFPTGSWHHVAASYDATPPYTSADIKVYIDGAQPATSDYSAGTYVAMHNTTTSVQIGAWDGGGNSYDMNGRIDEVRISSTALSACWIGAEYNNQAWPDKAVTPTPDPSPNPSEGFYGLGAATAVELVSFTARGSDAAVELAWETGSEMDNLGFHLYRATSMSGPYERVTASMIPGLGSSPQGARYRYLDTGLTNGEMYFYQLEDVETTGRSERHGPVAAGPSTGAITETEPTPEERDTRARLSYGEPDASSFRLIPQRNGVVLELETGGFVAVAQDDGTVRLEVPGLEEVSGGSLPVKRAWVEALAGRDVKVVSVRAREVERFDGLHPSGSLVSELSVSPRGTVQARLRREGRRHARKEGARLVDVAYQGETKKALVELSPLTWDGAGLVLAKKLEVRVAFRGRELSKAVRRRGTASMRLVAVEPGLYAIPLQELVGRRRPPLRLSRQGEDVPYHIEDGVFHFWSEGASANPYGTEAVYELEIGVVGERMEVAETSSATSGYFMETLEREENRYYQAALVDASDVWLWEVLFAPTRKSFPFEVRELSSESAASSLTLWLQGTSDFPTVEDHHVRVSVNGSYVGEGRWDGKTAYRLDVELGAGILREGENTLELESLSDTGAAYAMMMLDRFRVRYPRSTAVLASAGHVIELTDSSPRWLASGAGFESMGRYVGVDEVLLPERRNVVRSRLRKKRQADYVVIGPEALMDAAKTLLRHRRRQGLRTVAASTEAIASEFGHGELSPEAIRDFIGYAYHEWRAPRLRYVLLLGDATYDFKNYLGTDVTNQVPPFMVRTSYLWTASDPAYAAVNGDDAMPDVAIGRLPAKTPEELRAMVAKIVAYENGELQEEAPFVLVADNADEAGDFEQDADELASTLLAGRETNKIYLSQLGTPAARDAIVESFDRGASTMSYLGHGAINFWADENLFNNPRVATLSPQAQQPLVLTMNCLNGYFHFPYFDSLAESLVKQSDKGAIAAFSPSGLSLNGPAHRYHQALLEQLLSARHGRLGDAVLAAQRQYADTGAFPELLSIYHLFGDPALTLR